MPDVPLPDQDITVRVALGERETDVLAWLVNKCPDGETRSAITAAMVERGVHRGDALQGVFRALQLLHALGLVATRGNELRLVWYATTEGVEAIRNALRAAALDEEHHHGRQQ